MKELEAINTLLSIIGEAPIDQLSDITVNEITDSSLARRTLYEVSRDVQAEGWGFNTDYDVTLAMDSSNQFPLPDNALRVDFSPNTYPEQQYVARGNRVYDRSTQRYDFGGNSDTLTVDSMVRQLDWDELPHAAQQYIAIRAGRIFSDRYINSNVVFAYTVQDETYARTQLIRAEESGLQNNMLWGNDRGTSAGLGFVPSSGTRYRYRVN